MITTKTSKLLTITAVLAAVLASFVPRHTHAQELRASLSHYSTDDGLKSNAISQILQDDYGYIWLATWNGLSRFDGFNFYNYQTGNGSHIPHLHNRILDAAIDQTQNLWLHMYDNRVFVLDRQKDRIVNPFEHVGNSEEYRSPIPPFITSSGDVLIYISGVGIYKMRMEDSKINEDLISTLDMTVTCIAEGYHDDIWVGTNVGVHRLDIGNLSIERKGLFTDEHISTLYSNGFNVWVGTKTGKIMLFSYGQEPKTLRQPSGDAVMSIYVDSHGYIWFADSRFGASCIVPDTGQEKHFEQKVLVPEHDGRGGVFRETAGVVWVRMNHGGYGYYNRETDQVEYFHNDPINPWNLSNTVNATLELPEGVIFESTSRRGLDKLDILKNNITRTLLVPDAESTIQNETRAMLYDKERHLMLMGNKDNTLFVTKEDGSRTTITHDSQGNSIGRIYGISKDSKGNYWLCSKDYGLIKMTPTGSGWQLVTFAHQEGNKWSLSSNSAYATVEDKNGNIWVATYGGGVNLMTKNKAGQTIFLHHDNEIRQYPYNAYLKVRTITTDSEGNVWAGTTDGILIMSYEKGKITLKKLEESEEEPDKILMSNDIVYIARDLHKNMWIGTHGGGLSHTVGKDSKGRWLFETFGSKDGLPSEEIKSITFDQLGNVWFATDHVICSYDIQKKIFTTFSSLDGVDETMCSEGAAITLPNGNILIGTLNGYYTIDRKKLTTDNGSLLKLRITDFFLDDELQSPRFSEHYSYYVPDAKEVRLPSHSSKFTFRFAAMNYQLQHRVHYQYMLEGYDRQWVNADKSRTASYENVPAGTYRFKVKAFLLESPDKFDMKTIEVTVPPYFLLSSAAIWFYMPIVAILAILLMLWREEHLRRIHNVARRDDGLQALRKKLMELIAQKKKEKEQQEEEDEPTDEYEVIED